MLFATLAILPVSLTRLPTPAPPASSSVAVRAVWRVSPVGLAGSLTASGLTMLLAGCSPIHVAVGGYSCEDVRLLFFPMQRGLVAVQYPLGALSDRADRRCVLIGSCAPVVLASICAAWVNLDRFWLVAAVRVGTAEFIYSTAYANDWAAPDFYVSLSSTLMITWSLSSPVLPAATAALMTVTGPERSPGW